MQSATEPAYRPPDRQAREWVAARLGAAVVGVERLTGGITADVDRVTLAGDRPPVVLRRWTDPATWPERLVERETTALTALDRPDRVGVPAPVLLAADPTGELAGVPSLLMSEVAGRVDLAPRDTAAWVGDLARALVTIHLEPAVLTARVVHETVAPGLRWLADAGLRHDAHEVVRAAVDRTGDDDVFTHGDYQPYNVLWQDDGVSGVVDWPGAGTGPRGRDVGHCCLNLAVLMDVEAAVQFLRRYEEQAAVTVDRVVVARALLAWEPDWVEFILRQVAGRASVDLAGMAGRVTDAFRCILQQSDRA